MAYNKIGLTTINHQKFLPYTKQENVESHAYLHLIKNNADTTLSASDITINSNKSWLTVQNTLIPYYSNNGKTFYKFKFTVQENTGIPRDGKITITHKNSNKDLVYCINQYGKPLDNTTDKWINSAKNEIDSINITYESGGWSTWSFRYGSDTDISHYKIEGRIQNGSASQIVQLDSLFNIVNIKYLDGSVYMTFVPRLNVTINQLTIDQISYPGSCIKYTNGSKTTSINFVVKINKKTTSTGGSTNPSGGNTGTTGNWGHTGGCFVEGTKILVSMDGTTKNVEDVKVGDQIISYNVNTNTFYPTEVYTIICNENDIDVAEVEFDNGNKVLMSASHPLRTRKGWHSITCVNGYEELVVGDEVKSFSNDYVKITSINRYNANPPIVAYAFAVHDYGEWPDIDDNDNFIVNDICAHNVFSKAVNNGDDLLVDGPDGPSDRLDHPIGI